MGELPNEGTSFLKVSGMKLVFSKAKLKKKKAKTRAYTRLLARGSCYQSLLS